MLGPSFVIFTFLSILLAVGCIAPTIWHFKHRNAAGVCLGFWIILLNLVGFIGAVVWRNDAVNRAPIWCDISVKIQIGGPMGILASCLCIASYLAEVLSPGAVLITQADLNLRRRVEYAICLGFPVIIMAGHYVYQSFRYAIAPGFGCEPSFAMSWPTIVLFIIWAPLLSIVGTLVGLYILYRSYVHRRSFQAVVESSSHAITASRFRRLAGLSLSYLIIYTPVSLYAASQLFQVVPLVPYNWQWFHNGLDKVLYYPIGTPLVPSDWAGITAGLCVMVFFGFGLESWTIYRGLLVKLKVLAPLPLQPPTSTMPSSLSAQLQKLNLQSQSTEDTGSVASDASPEKTGLSMVAAKAERKLPLEQMV